MEVAGSSVDWIFYRKLILPASFHTIMKEVENVLRELQSEVELSEYHFGRLYIAIAEAVNNACRHGSCNTMERHVKLLIKANRDSVLIEVEDEGEGFDYEAVLKEVKKGIEPLDKPEGRGVYLMYKLSDVLNFEMGGRKVCMEFFIGQ